MASIAENDLLHHWYSNIEQEDLHIVQKYGNIIFQDDSKKTRYKFYTWLKNTKALAIVECTLQWMLVCLHTCYQLNILHCRPETKENGMLMDGEKFAAVVRYIKCFHFLFCSNKACISCHIERIVIVLQNECQLGSTLIKVRLKRTIELKMNYTFF